MLLLDTHAWVWAVEGDARRIGRQACQLISRAEAAAVRISPATLFEIVALHTAGRLHVAPVLLTSGSAMRSTAQPCVWLSFRLPWRSMPVTPHARSLLTRLTGCSWRRRDNSTPPCLTRDAGLLAYAAGIGNVRVRNAAL